MAFVINVPRLIAMSVEEYHCIGERIVVVDYVGQIGKRLSAFIFGGVKEGTTVINSINGVLPANGWSEKRYRLWRSLGLGKILRYPTGIFTLQFADDYDLAWSRGLLRDCCAAQPCRREEFRSISAAQ